MENALKVIKTMVKMLSTTRVQNKKNVILLNCFIQDRFPKGIVFEVGLEVWVGV